MAAAEFDLIARCFSGRGATRPEVLLGVGDDAALVDVGAPEALALCVDTLVAGVHFPVDAPAASVGHKALAVNLSDLAAMGARPAWALLAVTAPAADADWLAAFADGLDALARRYEVALIGGDTCQGPLSISVQLAGWVEPAQALRRDRARAGDYIYVSGCLGEAAAGLRVWQTEPAAAAPAQRAWIERLHRPEPRLALGRALRGIAHAAVDVSDGFCADLGHILQRSGVGAEVDLEMLPRLQGLAAATALEFALGGGDDYELCFTVAPEHVGEVDRLASELALPLSRVGRVEAAPGLRLRQADGSLMAAAKIGYQHFGDPA